MARGGGAHCCWCCVLVVVAGATRVIIIWGGADPIDQQSPNDNISQSRRDMRALYCIVYRLYRKRNGMIRPSIVAS